jgi:hypothetical protein
MPEAISFERKKNNTFMQLLSKVSGQNLRNIWASESYCLRKLAFLGIKRQMPGPMTFSRVCHAHSIVSCAQLQAAHITQSDEV